MPGLDPNIVVYIIPLLEGMEPKQQRLRRMSPEMSLKIKDEVTKQLNAGFLEVPLCPKWIANVVSVPKKDGKGRV